MRKSVVLGSTARPGGVVDRIENLLHLGEKIGVERFLDLADILEDAIRACGADDGGVDVGIGDRELKGKFGEIGSLGGAVGGRLGALGCYLRRSGVP